MFQRALPKGVISYRSTGAIIKSTSLAVLVSSYLFLGFATPKALAQVSDEEIQARCWLQQQCEEDFGGIWGMVQSDRYAATGASKNDGWSEMNCRPLGPENKPTARCFTGNPSIPLQVGIPGTPKRFCSVYRLGEQPTECRVDSDCQPNKGGCRSGIEGGFPGYMAYFYKFFIGALAVFSVALTTWGGFKRIMAAGSAERLKDANDVVFKAVIGLVLALISYSLLNLINPRLVANTVPLIEKVRPEFFGFCPAYSDASSAYENGYKEFVCQGGTNPNTVCQKNEHCPGGLCVAGETKYAQRGLPYSPVGDTCGKKLVLNGRECVATECSSRQGCFQINGTDPAEYACSDYTVQGKLGVVTEVDLMMVCNDNTTSAFDCSVSAPNGLNADTVSTEGRGSYAISGCWEENSVSGDFTRLTPSYCDGSGGFKGIALLAKVEAPGTCINIISGHGEGCDDWYAIDASTCTANVTGRIDGSPAPQNDPKAPFPFSPSTFIDWRLRWNSVSNSQLLNPFDAAGNLTPIVCNLNITRSAFPDRNDVY